MPAQLTHSAVNSAILGGPAVQGLHWHPTLVLEHKQPQVLHTGTHIPELGPAQHMVICEHTHTHTH